MGVRLEALPVESESLSIITERTFLPIGCGQGSIDFTVPVILECTFADINPSVSPILSPVLTLSSTLTRGFAGLPVCCEREIITERDLLQEQYQIVSSLSPQTNYNDYKKAQLALLGKKVSNEEFTWSEEEINRFLPKDLKLKNE